jgi:GTP cyclohydrolase I
MGSAILVQVPLQAQGCAQCRESLGQTPARTQQAYRRAISLMVASGAAVFTGAFILLKRFR